MNDPKGRRLAGAAALTFVTSIALNASNYVFQALAGRWQSPADYTVMQTFFSFWSFVIVPSAPLLLLVSSIVARAHAAGDRSGVRHAIRHATRVIALFAVALALVAAIAGSRFDAYFYRPTPTARWLLVAAIVVSLYAQMGLAVLIGLVRFGLYNLSLLVGMAAKLVFCLLPLRLGAGLEGVMLGMAITNVVLGALSFVEIRRTIAGAPPRRGDATVSSSAVAATVVGNIGQVALTQVDLAYATHYLPRESDAGYAGAATLAKLLFQLPTTIAIAMFPLVSDGSLPRKRRLRLLGMSLAMTAALVTVGMTVYLLAPSLVLRLTFGARYVSVAGILPACAWAAAPYAFVTVLVHYAIARQRRRFLWILAFIAVVAVVGLYMVTPALSLMLLTIGVAGVLATIVGLATLIPD